MTKQISANEVAADFRHRPQAALESIIREAISMGGDEPDDDEVAGIVGDAVDIRSHEVGEMCDVLESHGSSYSGNNVDDVAEDWIDHGFAADDADKWCDIGVWDAATAAEFRDADKSPKEIRAAAERLIEEAGDDARDTYTDGDPIYAACNNDLPAQTIIDACE